MCVGSGQIFYICVLAWARRVGDTESGVGLAIVAHCAVFDPPLRNIFPGRASEMTSGLHTPGTVTYKSEYSLELGIPHS